MPGVNDLYGGRANSQYGPGENDLHTKRNNDIYGSGKNNQYGPFRPTFFPDCYLWLDAALGISTSGGNVYKWEDQSGNGYDVVQATAGDRPAFSATESGINSLPAVDFGGPGAAEQEFMASANGAFTLAQPYVVFAVFKRDSIVGASPCSRLYAEYGGVDGTYYVNASGKSCIKSGTELAATADATTESWHVHSALYNGAASKLWLDGTELASGNAGTNAMTDGIRVGHSLGSNVSYYFDGQLAELIIYNRNLSSIERKHVEDYLGEKYGITVS